MSVDQNPRFYPENPVNLKASKEIQSQVDAYLSKGGAITEIPFGVNNAEHLDVICKTTYAQKKNCQQCGTEFTAAKTQGRQQKFCKKACRVTNEKMRAKK